MAEALGVVTVTEPGASLISNPLAAGRATTIKLDAGASCASGPEVTRNRPSPYTCTRSAFSGPADGVTVMPSLVRCQPPCAIAALLAVRRMVAVTRVAKRRMSVLIYR